MILIQVGIDGVSNEIKTQELTMGKVSSYERRYADWINTAVKKAIEHVSGLIKSERVVKIGEKAIKKIAAKGGKGGRAK